MNKKQVWKFIHYMYSLNTCFLPYYNLNSQPFHFPSNHNLSRTFTSFPIQPRFPGSSISPAYNLAPSPILYSMYYIFTQTHLCIYLLCILYQKKKIKSISHESPFQSHNLSYTCNHLCLLSNLRGRSILPFLFQLSSSTYTLDPVSVLNISSSLKVLLYLYPSYFF